jgi:hypothetical protein
MIRAKTSPEVLEARKAELLQGLLQARQQILVAAARVPLDRQDTPCVGTWSLKDLLAHLEGWDKSNQEALQAVLQARLPAFYAAHERGWKTFNAGLVAAYRQDNLEQMLAALRASCQELMRALEAVAARDFDRDTGVRFKGYKITIGRLLEAETSDEQEHARQILAFLAKECA